jgi:predicted secreted acid phosphatase
VKPGEKQALVLDIDNTTLETDFGFSYPQPANKPVLDVAKYAQERGVSLFFVTARPGIISGVTDYNLKYVGYKVSGLYVRGLFDLFKDVAAYKTAQRVNIESKGYTIIGNIGNSATDLSGGHAPGLMSRGGPFVLLLSPRRVRRPCSGSDRHRRPPARSAGRPAGPPSPHPGR